ncbi:hypothetical protein MMC07_006145 [Pseudocyphellaria aurata]|nr:hypothetical protein [Pseudocyphellaria aurata]
MASSNRNSYPRQENSHGHLTAISNSFTPPITKSRKSNAATAQMTPPNPSLISPNGIYGSNAPMHHMDQERQISPSTMNLDYGMNGGQDTGLEVDENPRKRANNEPQDYPRRRATIACEVCRGRKSRCDGGKPRCKLCTELKVDCVYREPGIKLDAGHKLILEHLERLDTFLRSNIGGLVREPALNVDPFLTNGSAISRDGMETKRRSHTGDGSNSTQNGGFEIRRESLGSTAKIPNNPTLHFLGWPKIRDLVANPYDLQLLLQLEMKREPFKNFESLSLDTSNNNVLIQAFFNDANVWYACVNPSTWALTYKTAESKGFREVPESCLVLLVLALGSTSIGGNVAQTPRDEEPSGMQYFSAAWGILPYLISSHDILASQCIILASAYLLYLVRPFEAWSLLSSTNTKLQLLFSPHGEILPHSKELSNRVIWNAILFETHLLYELDLPQSNLIPYETTLDLPSAFPEEDYSTYLPDKPWYLISTISLHRLHIRIQQMIYGKDAPTTTGALEPIVADLDARLSHWESSSFLEQSPRPTLDPHPAETSLRLRYHATRASIFRPFLLAILDSSPPTVPHGIRSACTKCLESCVRLLDYYLTTDYQSSHSPYVWQDTLLAVNGTLQLMGASMVTDLAELLPSQEDLDGMIDRVVQVVEGLGERAPSLKVAGEILREAEGRRKDGWWRNGSAIIEGAGGVSGGY